MQEVTRFVFENKDGKIVRSFASSAARAHIIRRSPQRRLELVPNEEALEQLREKKIKFEELGVLDISSLKKNAFNLAELGVFRLSDEKLQWVEDLELKQEKSRFSIFLSSFLVFGAAFLLVVLNINIDHPKIEEELQQQIVRIVKKAPPPKMAANVASSEVQTNTTKPTNKVALRRMGALGVLGSLQKSNQKGGINLGAVQTTAGPGLGGAAGSGGVQTNIYAKGLVAAPLGAGGNLQGGGGYGTKGKGGGKAGYGKLSLVGSAGTSSIPLVDEASVGGGLDKDLIYSVIMKNFGQIRFCYEQGLQGDPSLHGRVAVGFTITPNGGVNLAQVDSSSLNSKMVEDCILLRLRSWKFPLPEGGKEVKVSFPFVLRRTGQG